MRKLAAFMVIVLVGSLLASSSVFGATIYYGELNTFTSTTDANLDLNPATKVYAINLASESDATVNNGIFSLTLEAEWPTGASLNAASQSHANDPAAGFDPNLSGTGAAELKTALGTGRIAGLWTPEYGWDTPCSTFVDLVVTSGKTYDLQLLIAENNYADSGQRGGSIIMDGTMLVENYATTNLTGDPMVYHYTFTAADSDIQVEIKRAAAGTFSDNGSMVNVLTLSEVPEPSTIMLLSSGLLGLLAYAWRKRK